MTVHEYIAGDKRAYKGEDARLFRVVCSCGWAGVWAYAKIRAEQDFLHHQADPAEGGAPDLSYALPVDDVTRSAPTETAVNGRSGPYERDSTR